MDLADSYEYQERAAIRQFYGGYDSIEASQLALIDMKQRQDPGQNDLLPEGVEKIPDFRQVDNRKIERSEQKPPDELQMLQCRRDEVGAALRAENNPQRKNRLFAEWSDLCRKIIELKRKN